MAPKRKRAMEDPLDRVDVKLARKGALVPLKVSGWRNASAKDVVGPAWPKQARTYCCWEEDEQYEMWREVLDFRGWRYAGPLCSPMNTGQMEEIALGRRKPPKGVNKHCLYISTVPEEVRMLCAPKGAQKGKREPVGANWKLSMFPGMMKATLKRATASQMAALGARYYPETYTLPRQRGELIAVAKAARAAKKSGRVSAASRSLWIAKPHEGYAGKGMVVFDAASPEFSKFLKSDLSAHFAITGKASRKQGTTKQKDTVVQRYIANPLLLGGYKFHMRVYILVTRLGPEPQAFLHRDLQMMTTVKPFSLAPSTFGKTFDAVVHITNDAVQFTEENWKEIIADKPTVGRGGFMDIGQFEGHLKKAGIISREAFWKQVLAIGHDVVRGIAKSPEIGKWPEQAQGGRHFEMLGCDMLIDAKGKVWLMEVNDSPGVQPEHYHMFDGKPFGEAGSKAPLTNPDKPTCDGGMWRLLHDTVSLLGMDGSVRAGKATAADANVGRFWCLFP